MSGLVTPQNDWSSFHVNGINLVRNGFVLIDSKNVGSFSISG